MCQQIWLKRLNNWKNKSDGNNQRLLVNVSTNLNWKRVNELKERGNWIGSDDKRGRHKEQLLPFPYALQSHKSSLSHLHPIYPHLLRRKPRLRQPPLERRRTLQRLNLASPSHCVLGSRTGGHRAANLELPWEGQGTVRHMGVGAERGKESGEEGDCWSFGHGREEQGRQTEPYLINSNLKRGMVVTNCLLPRLDLLKKN